MKKFGIVVFAFLIWMQAGAQPFLQGKISDPRFSEGRISEPKTQQENLEALFTYASVWFADMIYGRSFTYFPTHNDRKITSQFEWTNPSELNQPKEISVFDIERDEIFMSAWFRYDLSSMEQKRLSVHADGVRSAGTSSIDLFSQTELLPLLDAYDRAKETAVKNAAKSYFLRQKPREIRGRLILERMPFVSVQSGEYAVQAVFRVYFTQADYFDYF